jgi:hypothetical protein
LDLLDLRLSVLTRYISRAGRPLHRTGLGFHQASLYPTLTPFLIFHDLSLSLICLYCWRNVLACLFPIQTRVLDRSYRITSDATILFEDAGLRPQIIRAHRECRTGVILMRRKPTRKSPTPRTIENGTVVLDICSIELSNRVVNKITLHIFLNLLHSKTSQSQQF